MRGTLVAICDPTTLAAAWDTAGLSAPGGLRVSITGRKVRVGGNAALTQVLPDDGSGAPIAPGQKVVLSGKAPAASYLYLRAGTKTASVYVMQEALFDHLGLAGGGTAQVDVTLEGDHLRFVLHRADGSTQKPVAIAGPAGPGLGGAVPDIPAGYADTTRQAAQTYIAAVNARDGKTLCMLFTERARRVYGALGTPCWAAVAGLIDYTGENADRGFRSMSLEDLDGERHALVGGRPYVGLPIHLAVLYRRLSYRSNVPRTRLLESMSDVLWFERRGGTWRLAKPPLSLMGAGAVGRGRDEDPLAPPGR